MPLFVRPLLLALAGAIVAVAPGQAQLDLRPPGVSTPGRSAAPAVRRPAARALQAAPLPLPRPPEADEEQAPGEPQLATVPPAEAPSPAAPAATAQPVPGASAPAPEAPAQPDPASAASAAPPAAPAAADETPAAPPATAPNRFDEAFVAASTATGPALTPTRPPPPYALPPERPVEGRPFAGRTFPVGREAHLPAVRRLAGDRRVPIDLADTIIAIESAYDPHAVGMADEIGLMQIRLSTARELGFEGGPQLLFEPETNIRLGTAYLAGAWERAGGNLCEALARYRNGWDSPRMSPLTMEYCRRAVIHLTAIGSQLVRTPAQSAAPQAPRGPSAPTPPSSGSADPVGGTDDRFNWSDHETRIRQIEQRFGGDNFGIIAR
ncbi:lytic transglycosylase domain-containing protein [Phreatobacter sp.]|uniref:lytic transglycosylase domain-containing protein n=1 Tax=Phreatobacter sp. TaxID=1966341 RepID=UPI003F70AE7A